MEHCASKILTLHGPLYQLSSTPHVLYMDSIYVIYYNERLKGVTYPDGYSDYVGSDLCEMEVYGTSYFCAGIVLNNDCLCEHLPYHLNHDCDNIKVWGFFFHLMFRVSQRWFL